MNNLHIFICHYTPLKERKLFILNQLNDKIGNLIIKDLECEFDKEGKEYKSENFDESKPENYVYFIRKYDRDYLTPEIIDKFFIKDRDICHNVRRNVERFNEKPEISYDNYISEFNHCIYSRLKMTEMSLGLKHYEACRLISTMDINYGLVIEDDCTFAEDFIPKLNNLMKEFPDNWNIYIPNSSPRPGFKTLHGHIKLENTNKIFIKNAPNTVFGSSIFFRKSTADIIFKDIEKNKILLPIDHEYNWIFFKNKFIVLWNDRHEQLTFWNKSGMKSTIR